VISDADNVFNAPMAVRQVLISATGSLNTFSSVNNHTSYQSAMLSLSRNIDSDTQQGRWML